MARTSTLVVPFFFVTSACAGATGPARSTTQTTSAASADDVGSSAPSTLAQPHQVELDAAPRTTFERRTTWEIRHRLLADDDLSATAKNVDVVTEGTKVTVRGEVKDEAERARVLRIVRRTTGITEVLDRLEIEK